MSLVFGHQWLGGLFGDPAIEALWSADAQLAHYRAFEVALAQALATAGIVTEQEAQRAAQIIANQPIAPEDLAADTARDGLPIPAFVRILRKAAGEAGRAVHTGATSQDVLDTALALTLRGVTDVLLARLKTLDAQLAALEGRFSDATLMGRTRMQAALPITAGHRLASWRAPLADHIAALGVLRPMTERLQLAGAVGTRAEFKGHGDAIAAQMAHALGLVPSPVWHTDRNGIVAFGSRLSQITGSMGKIGQDIALMAQQGIGEIVLATGGGSSAMPHKSNPILAELLVTLARVNSGHVASLHQALVHEQERSGAAWMIEWMVLPQICVIAARATAAAAELCGQVTHLGSQA